MGRARIVASDRHHSDQFGELSTVSAGESCSSGNGCHSAPRAGHRAGARADPGHRRLRNIPANRAGFRLSRGFAKCERCDRRPCRDGRPAVLYRDQRFFPPSFGFNPTGAAFNPNIFNLFDAWVNSKSSSQASIVRGQTVFTLESPSRSLALGASTMSSACRRRFPGPVAPATILRMSVTTPSRRP